MVVAVLVAAETDAAGETRETFWARGCGECRLPDDERVAAAVACGQPNRAQRDLPLPGLPDGNEVAVPTGSTGLREHHQAAVAGPRHAGELEMDCGWHVGKVPEVARCRVEQPDVGDLRAASLVGGIGEVKRNQSA